MIKITNEVLAERMDGIKNNFDTKFDILNKNFDSWKKHINDDIVPKIDENTKFRQNIKGIIAFITTVSIVAGGTIMWLIEKIKFWAK